MVSLRLMQRGMVALLLALALCVGVVGTAAAHPVAQAGTATISGRVYSADGQGLPNVKLAAYNQSGGSPNRVALLEFQSGADGRYSVQVPAGTVWMAFLTQDVLGQSFWGYDYTPINVVAGVNQSNINFEVAIRVVSTPQPVATAVPPTAVPPTAVPPTAVPPTPLPPPPTIAPPEPPMPQPTPGMPVAGHGTTPLDGLLLLVLGVLALGSGLVLHRRLAPRA